MTIPINSRFITYPDTVENEGNHTVLLIDASPEEVATIGYFCKVSNKNYDIYLYRGDTHHLEWLNNIDKLVDYTLINNSSQVTISNSDKVLRYGQTLSLIDPLTYFQKIDDQVDQP